MRFSFLLGFLLLGCGKDICIRHSDCVSGEVCGMSGVCAIAADGGVDAETDADVIEPDAMQDAGVDAMEDAAVDAATDGTTDEGS